MLFADHGSRILWSGVLVFYYLILIHQRDNFGSLYNNQVEPRQLVTSEFIGCRYDGPPIAARLYLTNSAKRKRRKPPWSATDAEKGPSSNSTSMLPTLKKGQNLFGILVSSLQLNIFIIIV